MRHQYFLNVVVCLCKLLSKAQGVDVYFLDNMFCLTFKDGCGLQDLLLYPGVLTTDGCKELQNQLCTLRLPSSRLTTVTQRHDS